MMKFLVFDSIALEEIVSGKEMQSTEYEYGGMLASILKGKIGSVKLSSGYSILNENGGVYFLSDTAIKQNKYFVIDIEQSDPFSKLSDSDALFAFQKAARFVRKYWEGLTFNYSEKLIQNTTKAVLFPFRYTAQPYRMVFEREPRKERLARRDLGGKFILMYKAGYSSGDSEKEEAGYTNFTKVLDTIEDVQAKSKALKNVAADEVGAGRGLGVTDLSIATNLGSGSLFRGYDEWLPSLTQHQRHFVESPFSGAHRIEGPAGTGKTLCLILRAVSSLRDAELNQIQRHIVFITHSEATKNAICEILSVVDAKSQYSNRERNLTAQSLKVCTLSQLCAETLNQSISESELLDRDAMESKNYQLLHIIEAIKEVKSNDLASHERYLSPDFLNTIKNDDIEKLASMFQHEISVLIKGRSSEKFHVYKDIPSLKYGLPVRIEADKGLVFAVFKKYQDALGISGQFDTDDVVLSAIGQLDTPIWRRRRLRDGCDALFIDETHLFNINELHLFHFFTRDSNSFPIVYSVDRSQAVGDHGWTTVEISAAVEQLGSLDAVAANSGMTRMQTVFRSSPEIVDLAVFVLSSGAMLFTNFENPAESAISGFTEREERLSKLPSYYSVINEARLLEVAFERAEDIQQEIGCKKGQILIVVLDEALLRSLKDYAEGRNKPIVVLDKRGDVKAVEAAKASGQFVLGHADFVGGLEFHAVIIVGLDQGRVPPSSGQESECGRNFLDYSAHNRLYVSITRAKYRVEMLGERSRGESKLIRGAIDKKLIDVINLI